MAEQAQISTDKNLPRGSVEGMPTRQTGHEENHSKNPLDDSNTEKRRMHYGEEDKFYGSNIHGDVEIENVNDTKLPNNPTRDERIRGSNSDQNPETGFARHMCQ